MGARLIGCVLAIAAGCGSPSPFACGTSDQCVLAGARGTCESQGFCSFADSTCPSGRRFEPNAGDGLGGSCATGGSGADAGVDAPASLGPITFIQTAGNSASTVSSITASFSTATAAHHTIIACVNVDLPPTATVQVTDNAGNHYVPVVGPISSGEHFYIFAAFDVKAGTTMVTYMPSVAALSNIEVYIHEYSGLRGFDVGAAAGGTSTAADAVQSGAAVTTWPHDLIFGFSASGGAVTAGTGFTQRSSFNSNMTEDKVVTSTGSYQATGTANMSWTILMAAFEGE